jgi:hypothetical protein
MFHFLSTVRQPRAKPPRSRPSLEPLSDRILPSVHLAGPAPDALVRIDLSDPESDQLRFVEIPNSDSLLTYWGSGAFSLSAQQMVDILGGPSRVQQLGTPVVARDTVELGGETFPALDLRYGSTLAVNLAFGGDRAGSAGKPGSVVYAPLLGGLVEVYTDGGERRFLMQYQGAGQDGPDGPPLVPLPDALRYLGDGKSTHAAPGDRPALGGQVPTEAVPLAEPTGPSPPPFIPGWPGGMPVAGGLVEPPADDAWENGAREVAADAPGNPADVLLTVDTVLPDTKADLVRLQNADLTIVPTYVVEDAPAAPAAPPRADDHSDLGLTARVVGLDESPGGVASVPSAADRLFEQLAWVGGGHGVEAWRPAAARVQSDGIEVGDAPHAAPADAGLALREWLDGFLQQNGEGAAVVSALALEGLLAYVCWRGWRPAPPRS